MDNVEVIKFYVAVCVLVLACVSLAYKRGNTITQSWYIVLIAVLFSFVVGSHAGVYAQKEIKEPVECAVQGSPIVHGKKLNVIDLTLVCDGYIVEVKDQQIGYNFSESGVKRNARPAPKTAINP